MDWLIDYYKKNDVRKIAYIMNAAKPSVQADPRFVFNDKEKLAEAGFNADVVNLDEISDMTKHFDSYDSIYIRGGNTFCLLGSVRKSGFDKVLPGLLDKGKVYASTSAGSILPAPSIETTENNFMSDENIVGLEDKSGLNIVDFAIFPHWEDRFEKDFKELIKKQKVNYPVYKLYDNELILIEGGEEKRISV